MHLGDYFRKTKIVAQTHEFKLWRSFAFGKFEPAGFGGI